MTGSDVSNSVSACPWRWLRRGLWWAVGFSGCGREMRGWAILFLCEFSSVDGVLAVRSGRRGGLGCFRWPGGCGRGVAGFRGRRVRGFSEQRVRVAVPAATGVHASAAAGALRVCRLGGLAEYYSQAPEYISVSMHESRAPLVAWTRRNLLQLLLDAGRPVGPPEIFPFALIPAGAPSRMTGDGESTGWRIRCMRWSWSGSRRTGCAR